MKAWEKYFFNRTNFEDRKKLAYHKENFNLDKAQEIYRLAEFPARTIPKVHVAGTNGKGSTCLYLEQIALAAGHKTGLFLSPHVEEVNERIRINGFNASDKDLELAVRFSKKKISEAIKPTSFELLFLAALYLFETRGCTFLIIETGIGGRLDTTNIIKPLVSVITPIALDHVGLLGRDLVSIAKEKAGIIKPGVPLVTAGQAPEVEALLRARAKELNAEWASPAPFKVEEIGVRGTTLQRNDGSCWKVSMAGYEQAENLELAFTVASLIGLKYDQQELSSRLQKASLPARFEIFGNAPQIILDGAHNPLALARLGRIIRTHRSKSRIKALVGMMSDKDCQENIRQIELWADEIHCVDLPIKRAIGGQELVKFVKTRPAEYFSTIEEGLNHLIDEVNENEIVVITGSFILAGLIRPYLKSLKNT